ncbi:scavenger receptor cysteine-rich domain-containing group B protein-like [Acanthaster planci]|uniref:Scavenger receptor cysteine-rich domain-containing group B protein-like n=1 Tax=Acanthaster planci TaxID=133434 RepID=A0A8B7Z5M5_ACAPL|nr:scavenger receptor cysteine-rich domain-containing group B protein-like [Acanthaster planci]
MDQTGAVLQVVAAVFILQVFTTWAAPGSDLRLVGESSSYEGRLEVYHESTNQWGTVCDNSWDYPDAMVACRQLGFTAVTTSLYHLDGASAPILLDVVQCVGHEGRLAECSHAGWGIHSCTHSDDVAIQCGYDNTYVDPMPIRLVGGSVRSGRLEVYLDGAWGTVCDDNWDLADAQVACQQLGFTTVANYLLPAIEGATGPVHAYYIGCQGSETHLGQCVQRGGWGSRYCGHDEDVSVACESPHMETSLRLADGSRPNEGRLEIYHNGEWGTVCDDYWDHHAAAVACRQLSLGSPSPLTGVYIPQGAGSILLDDVMCQGWEARLVDCGHLAMGSHNCGHHEDVYLACSVEDFSNIATMPAPDSYTLHLADGLSHYEGRLELDINGVAGGICDTDWTLRDAVVACRHLGFGTAIREVPDGTFGVNYGGYYWRNNVTCSGEEATLQDCSVGNLGLGFCAHGGHDVGVSCTGPFIGEERGMRNAAVRLEGGSNSAEGRVEVLFNGEWSTVCDDGWDDIDAGVVCRQIGFMGAENSHHYIDGLPVASGPILLDQVRCEGDEVTIMGCRHNGLHTHDCVHDEDVVIKCYHNKVHDWKLGGGKVFGIVTVVCVAISLGFFIIRRRMQLEKLRNLLVVPESEQPEPAEGPGPGGLTSPRPYPVQPAYPQLQLRPPLSQPLSQPPCGPGLTAAIPPLPPVGFPDPNPLPASYMTTTSGADGVSQLPVYLPSPVAVTSMPPVQDSLPQVQGTAPGQLHPIHGRVHHTSSSHSYR